MKHLFFVFSVVLVIFVLTSIGVIYYQRVKPNPEPEPKPVIKSSNVLPLQVAPEPKGDAGATNSGNPILPLSSNDDQLVTINIYCIHVSLRAACSVGEAEIINSSGVSLLHKKTESNKIAFEVGPGNYTVKFLPGADGYVYAPAPKTISITDKPLTFEVNYNNGTKCLSYGTNIATPAGPKPVESLTQGDLVWTVNTSGQRVAAPLLETRKTITPRNYQIVDLTLTDNRELLVSWNHPLPNQLVIGDVQPGDIMDGSSVKSKKLMNYKHESTYDILPAGETGFYFANGILLASTLK